jgi:sec-independent protein translocase protein TatA
MIPGLPQVGGTELIILLTIILLLFGAKRIPELARSLGRGKREFHKGASEDADALRRVMCNELNQQVRQVAQRSAKGVVDPLAQGVCCDLGRQTR